MKPLRLLFAVIAVLFAAVPAVAAADSPPWHVYNLAPSGNALLSPQAMGQGDDVATFDFLGTPTTSYLLNHQAGDITDKTLTATFHVDGSGTLVYNTRSGNDIGGSPMVRLFFETSNAGGFDETHYWWSHAGAATLTVNGLDVTITASVGDPSDWSDFYGHFANVAPYSDGFDAAAANATYVGLSFGGGYFFANGVGMDSGAATLHLTSFTIS